MNVNKIVAMAIAGLLALLLPQVICAGTVSYEYDALYRLLRVAYSDGRSIDYSYDSAGNLTGTVVTGEPDQDGDGVPDVSDNCPNVPNADQANHDTDANGDACDTDDDNDGVPDTQDAFPFDPTEQVDTDGDGIGDRADLDDDQDGVADASDNCPLVSNPNQADDDHDGIGDVCDSSRFCWKCLPNRGGWRAILH
ncbi:thrombospondin type 3 repeat-containing protein [uncultured Thiodictyon sp.]|uniref:thrombospondin type 3 repeat-containing protein n=1 Tax=uncultured Thiodictyon sp. TaxID=1846217 RepID=UPI003455C29B